MSALLVVLQLNISTAAPVEPTSDEVTAEARRIRDSMRSLAQRNAWKGVDQKYVDLVELGTELSLTDHDNGAEAALNLGDVMARRKRLELAGQMGNEEVWPTIKSIDDGYGRIYLLGTDELVAASMPFEPEPRNAIVLAQSEVKSSHAFWGMLPTGTYTFASQQIRLESGLKPLLVSNGGITKLDDPFALIEETPGGRYLWNDIELEPVELAAVLRSRHSTRRMLEQAEASLGIGIGLGAGGLGLAVLLPPLLPIGAIAALASVPFLIRGATGRRRAIARWKEEWAASAD